MVRSFLPPFSYRLVLTLTLFAISRQPSDDPDTPPSASPMESANRCETVLNATLSETAQYHDTKNDDLKQLTVTFLDDEIAHHERVLERLKQARRTFDEPGFGALGNSPREVSRLEEELGRPTQAMVQTLRQPSPHVRLASSLLPLPVFLLLILCLPFLQISDQRLDRSPSDGSRLGPQRFRCLPLGRSDRWTTTQSLAVVARRQRDRRYMHVESCVFDAVWKSKARLGRERGERAERPDGPTKKRGEHATNQGRWERLE